MVASASIDVHGVRESLKVLAEIDKKQKWKAIAKIKSAGAPLIALAQENYPDTAPLSGWSKKGRLGYDPKKVRSGVQIQVGGRSKGDRYAIVTLVQKNAGGAMFDMAGFANNKNSKAQHAGQAQFTKLIEADFGRAQRAMWRNIAKIREIAAKEIMDALNEVAADANRKLS